MKLRVMVARRDSRERRVERRWIEIRHALERWLDVGMPPGSGPQLMGFFPPNIRNKFQVDSTSHSVSR